MSESVPTSSTQSIPSYASEPIRIAQLQLDRRAQRLDDLVDLRNRCGHETAKANIDECLAEIRTEVRDKALDEAFSVAVRERWQTWSRQSKPSRKDLASAAATADKSQSAEAVPSDSDSESSEDASAAEEEERPAKCPRNTASHAQEEDWDHIRNAREALLSDLDSMLPSAFRFDDRQLKVYAQRLKPRYYSSLEEPFHPAHIRRALRGNASSFADGSESSQTTQQDANSPVVLTISFFVGSLDNGELKEHGHDNGASATDSSFGQPRDDYINRVSGTGPDGMTKTQTVEILSTQTLETLRQSLFCWSDEQPEREGWSRRLQRQLRPDNDSPPEHEEVSYSPPYTREKTPEVGEEGRESRFATYTGKRRETDTILVIEDNLYGHGYKHGTEEHEQDYVTLLEKLNAQRGAQNRLLGFANGGDLHKRFDELEQVRVGQTYWMLHQGGCVHAFVIEQIRALRPEEEAAMNTVQANNTDPGSSGFPKVTWLTTPAILRFASDNTDNYSAGHRILHAEGHVAYAYVGTGVPTTRGANTTQRLAANAATARSKRRDESLLKWKKGRCFACSSRKAQIGMLGGDRVILHPSQPGTESIMPGVDEHFVSLCLPCAALLGLPTTRADSDGSPKIDWDAVNSQESRQGGWTAFPMY